MTGPLSPLVFRTALILRAPRNRDCRRCALRTLSDAGTRRASTCAHHTVVRVVLTIHSSR